MRLADGDDQETASGATIAFTASTACELPNGPTTTPSTYDSLPIEKKARFTRMAIEVELERHFGWRATRALGPALSACYHTAMKCEIRVRRFRALKDAIVSCAINGADVGAIRALLDSYRTHNQHVA